MRSKGKSFAKSTLEKGRWIHNGLTKSIATIFLLLLLVIFPWYFHDKYLEMSFYKWIFYVSITIVFLVTAFVLFVIGKMLGIKNRYSLPDLLVVLYGIIATISFTSCSYPKAAFMGTDGWYMGFVAQILFVLTYLVFSTQKVKAEVVITLNYVGSIFCFVVAICQRYGNDFLHLYWEMPAEIIRDYLSTIGNRTWFSAYVCTVCPIGIYLFWKAKNKTQLYLYGIYTYISFACIAVTNSDSAYAGIIAVLYILLLLSVNNVECIKRFYWVLILWSSACLSMALLRIPYEQEVRDLRGLSKMFLDTKMATILLIISVLLLYIMMACSNKVIHINASKVRKWILGSTSIMIGFVILVIVLNTTGLFQRCFGFTLQTQYLLFDDAWGDYRGSSWILTVEMFLQLPIKQMLFGVGPDCFAYYAYSDAEYSQYLNGFWGEAVLANAHNEWLNSIFCMGILGGLVYISIFVCVMIYCLKKDDDKNTNRIVPAIGLCIAGYMAHNFFCYQQVSATGVIFVLMGIAMCQLKETIKSN